MLQDFLVRSITQGYGPEVIVVHELIEEIGAKHYGLGNLDGGIVELVELRMTLDDIVEECQTTALTTQRAIANAGKVGIAVAQWRQK